jgi:thiamine pyrophosphate-dependent acetolactate synthase large subunit-like protein
MMTQQEALEVLAAHRGQRIVITTMGPIGVWPALSDTPLDFAYIPSAMGHATGLGLGLALAGPERGVIVVNGDGSMLMNLGSLVTLAAHPANVYLIVMDNQMYEVTGGQPTAGAGRIDFAGLARSAGFRRVYHFETREAWRAGGAEALAGPGPVFLWLRIEGRLCQKTPQPPRPMAQQLRRLREALGVNPVTWPAP